MRKKRVPPSTLAALAGATLLANLSASNAAVGKAEYRRALCANQSARCVAAYLYAGAGPGESTTDLAWDGHGLICENNDVVAESTLVAPAPQLLVADVDLERLRQDRMRMNTFADCEERTRSQRPAARVVEFAWEDGGASAPLLRTVERFTRTSQATMRYEYTVDDPGAYTKPFTGAMNLRWEAGTELFEYQCQQANYAHELMVGEFEKVDRTSFIVP